MSKTTDDKYAGIEETQAALRASIEKAKALALESERLIRPPPEDALDPEPPNPSAA